MKEQGISRNEIVGELARSTHGKLDQYGPAVERAAKDEPLFLAHLIAWNQVKGQVRDSKIAVPALTLGAAGYAFKENSLAHLALQSPRDLLRASRFLLEHRPALGERKRVVDLIELYLRAREADPKRFLRSVLQHRRSLHELYALHHIKPSKLANDVLFKGKKPGVLGTVARLKGMSASDAAAAVLNEKIPFLVAASSLGEHGKSSDFVLALVEGMTPTEVVTNTKMLEKMGVHSVPALRAAYDAKLREVAEGKKNTLKAAVAAKASGSKKLAKAAAAAAETLRTVDGDWLVLGDRSGSMHVGIEVAKRIAAALAASAKGRVHLVLFNASPTGFDVTGKSLAEIDHMLSGITANGGTSIGCGLQWAMDRNVPVDGVVVASDGGENNPPYFSDALAKFEAKAGKDVPVYYYKVGAAVDTFEMKMAREGHDMQTFDLSRAPIDYYSLPNIVQTMRPNRYSLADEILETPLRTVQEALRA